MRQIKFRVWDSQAKRMVHGLPRVCVKGDVGTEHGYTICDIDVFDGRFVLMQFTGLKDSNGKEIYEGDVVRLYDPRTKGWKPPTDFRGAIVFHQAQFQIEAGREGMKNLYWQLQSPEFLEVTVIGNIFENPELLK